MNTEKDPRVEAAMDEVIAVLKKHDVCGAVAITTPTALRYCLKPDATWNCTTCEIGENGSQGVRVNSKGFPQEKKKEVLEASAGTICALEFITRKMNGDLSELADMLAENMDLSFIIQHLEP